MKNISFTIAVCTRGTNSNLPNLIGNLIEIKKLYVRMYEIEIVIVVNSDEVRLKNEEDLQIVYQSTIGYSSARNTAVQVRKAGSNLIFIDDDEIPSSHWFRNLVKTHEKYPEDILVGPVYSVKQESQPSNSYRKQFEKGYQSKPDGSELAQGPTANMLIPSAILDQNNVRFDIFYDRSGSEDTDFCFRMRKLGTKIRFAKTAFLFENESSVRFTQKYIDERFIKDVANFSVVIRRNDELKIMFWRGLTLLVRILYFGIFMIFRKRFKIKFLAYAFSLYGLLTGRLRN